MTSPAVVVPQPRATAAPLQQYVPPGAKALRFSAPRCRRHLSSPEPFPSVGAAHRAGFQLRRPFPPPSPTLMEQPGDILSRVRGLQLARLTDAEAAWLTAPDAPHAHAVDDVLSALSARLDALSPPPRPAAGAWEAGEWWLTLRHPLSAAWAERHTQPLPWHARGAAALDALVADVADRLQSRAASPSLLHVEHVALSPLRAARLVRDGVLRNAARRLEALSLPFCEIGAAALLVLLDTMVLARTRQPQLRALHLAYNWIDASALPMLSALLGRTAIRRLSLRGNRLGGGEAAALQEFLLSDGCAGLEELDVAYTGLTRADVCTLIRCIPQMRNLEVLLLDGVHVPTSKAVALSSAIRNSELTYVSLKCIPACANAAYQQRIELACQRNRTMRRVLSEHGTARFLTETGSFFEAFARRANTCTFLEECALPTGYGPFKTNEPSLPPLDEMA